MEGKMSIRKAFALAGLVLAIAVLSPAAALAGKGGTDRPFKFSETGTGVTDLIHGVVSIALTGNGTHFGKFQHTEQGNVTPTIVPSVLDYKSTWHVVAANGDDVFGECAGTGTTSDGVHFLILLDCTSTDGTGRFAGVSGDFGAVVKVTYVGFDATMTTAYSEVEAVGVGTISY
jgi:hypothetical protein